MRLMGEADIRTLVPECDCASFLDMLKRDYPKETGNDVYESL